MGGEIFGLFALVLVAAVGVVWVRSFSNNPRRPDGSTPGDGGAGYWSGSDSPSRDSDREGGGWFSGLFGSSDSPSSESSSSDSGGSSDGGGGGGGGGSGD